MLMPYEFESMVIQSAAGSWTNPDTNTRLQEIFGDHSRIVERIILRTEPWNQAIVG